MNININLEQIKQSFNEKTLARGITYYNDKRVQSIAFDAAESQYNSRVAGQGKSIYFHHSVCQKQAALNTMNAGQLLSLFE